MTPLPSYRILHVNSMLKGGGTDDQCVKLAASQLQAGQHVWLAGPTGRDFEKVVREAGVPFHGIAAEGVAKWRFILESARLVRRHKIQILHSHHGRDIWPAVLIARLSGVRPKLVLTRHMAKSPSSWASKHLMLGQCDALIAVSEFAAKVLRVGDYEPTSPEPERHARPPIYGDHTKIHVAYGGIDTGKFRPFDAAEQRRVWGLAPGHFAFGVAGAYDFPRGKGQREFLQAAAQIHQAVPNARFLIIGRGTMAEVLQADIARLGLQGKAWLTPYGQDMPAAMNALDCLVHPAIGTEAFGLVICEAHACGKPVIAADLDGIPEAFRAGGYGQLVTPENVAELAAAMQAWAEKPRLSESERQALHQKIDAEFSSAAAAHRVLSIYQRLLAPAAQTNR